MLRLFLVLTTLYLGVAGGMGCAVAQTSSDDQRLHAQWEQTASQAEALLDLPIVRRTRVSPDQWEAIRLQLTVQREMARAMLERGTLKERIIAAQLEELSNTQIHEVEPTWVKQRREALNEELAHENRPAIAAHDSYARASVLIKEIDERLREKLRSALFAQDHSLFQARTWEEAAAQGYAGLTGSADPIERAASGGFSAPSLAQRLLLSLCAGLASFWVALHVRGRLRRWLDAREENAASARSSLGFAFLRDLLDIAGPAAALIVTLIIMRSFAADLPVLATYGTELVSAGFLVIFAHWLGQSLFEPAFPPARLLALPEGRSGRAIRLITILGACLAAEQALETMLEMPHDPAEFGALASLAIILISSFGLWRLGSELALARGARAVAGAGSHHTALCGDLFKNIARLLKIVAILLPVTALAGFLPLSRYIFSSLLFSLAAAGTCLFLFRSITEAAALLFHPSEKAESRYFQLFPLFFGFLLFAFATVLIALFWGMSVEAVVDGILALKNGVALGNVRISFGNVMTFGFVFATGYVVTRWLQRALHYAVLDRLKVEPGLRSAVLTAFGYVGLTLSALLAITSAGMDLSSLAFIAGALSVGVGFGLQSVVSNFVSGIILLIERPVKVGDWIEVGGHSGHVRRIAFRSTHIETFDKHEVILPNSELISGSVTNLTYGGNQGRITLSVGVSYGSDLETARRILREAAERHPRILDTPPPNVVLDSLGDSAINLNLLCFVDNVNQRMSVRSELYFGVVAAFAEAGVIIPYPQRDVWIHSEAKGTDGP